MIEELEISNFKAIQASGQLELHPRLNVLVGPNGSGKSSLVEALRFLHESVVRNPSAAVARLRGMNSVRHRAAARGDAVSWDLSIREKASKMRADYLLKIVEDENGIDVFVHHERLRRKVKAGPGKLRDLLEFKKGKGFARDARTKRKQKVSLSERELALHYLADRERHAQIQPFAEDMASWRFVNPVPALMRPPTPLDSDPSWQETGVAVALQLARATPAELQEIADRVQGLVQGASGLAARISSEGALLEMRESIHDGVFPSWTLSDGTLRLLAILTAIHVGSPPAVLCVEEPENSLHANVIDALLEEFSAAADEGTQVIITTHSPYLLNRVTPNTGTVFWVTKPQGAAQFIRVTDNAKLQKEMERFGFGTLLEQGALGKIL